MERVALAEIQTQRLVAAVAAAAETTNPATPKTELQVQKRTVHIHMPVTLEELKASPNAAVWTFTPKSVALNSLSVQDANGTHVGDTRKAFVTKATVSNQQSNYKHGEISYNMPMFPHTMANRCATQTGTIHPKAVNPMVELVLKPETELNKVAMELVGLTEAEIRSCFFRKADNSYHAVDKGTPAARAVVMQENCEVFVSMALEQYIAKNKTAVGFQQPGLYTDFGQSAPVILLSPDYYEFALACAVNFAKKQEDFSEQVFTNLAELSVVFKPSDETWAAVADRITARAPNELAKQELLQKQFYMSFDLNLEYMVCHTRQSLKTSEIITGS
jgi:hypothetical protein